MNTPFDENRNVSDAPIFDPFPEPRVYPSGWDLSDFILPSTRPSDIESPYMSESQTN